MEGVTSIHILLNALCYIDLPNARLRNVKSRILYYMIWYDIILCYILLYYILLYFILLYYILLYYIILYYIILYYIKLNYIILYYIILYYIILYYIIYDSRVYLFQNNFSFLYMTISHYISEEISSDSNFLLCKPLPWHDNIFYWHLLLKACLLATSNLTAVLAHGY